MTTSEASNEEHRHFARGGAAAIDAPQRDFSRVRRRDGSRRRDAETALDKQAGLWPLPCERPA
ncbi:MAG TPA: hypothetical protein VFR86_12675 [Burkholderiaceae bacterium]|nr:hypothetical protein [Burkholderiaceae bacterium]